MKCTIKEKVYHNKNSDVLALQDIHIALPTKGLFFLVGESGCGKTTFLQILAGIDLAYEGTREIDTVSYASQDVALIENFTIYQYLQMFHVEETICMDLLQKFQLFDLRDKKIKYLSVGEKKRVQIVSCLIQDASLYLFDEPTAALDLENKKILMDALYELSKSACVIIATHDQDLVDGSLGKILTLQEGRLMQSIEETLTQTENQRPMHQKSFFQHLSLLLQYMKAYKWDTLLNFIFLFCLFFIMYAGFSFFQTTNQINEQMQTWQQGNNFVVSRPKDENRKLKAEDQDVCIDKGTYFYYDTFQETDIQEMLSKYPEIIGYYRGWDFQTYSASPQFLPLINKKDVDERIKMYESRGYQKEAFLQDLKDNTSFEKDGESYVYDRYQIRGFPSNNLYIFWDLMSGYLTTEIDSTNDFIDKKTIRFPIHVYEMVDYTFPLLCGRQIQEENEIVIPLNLAKKIAYEVNGKDDIYTILNTSMKLVVKENIVEDDAGTMSGNSDDNAKEFKIVGITSFDHKEDRVYMKNQSFHTYRSEAGKIDADRVSYQFVKLLLDPSIDADAWLENFKKDFLLYDSEWVLSNTKDETTQNVYSDSSLFQSLFLLASFFLFISFVIYEYFVGKRFKKDTDLMKTACYRILIIEILWISVLCIVAGIIGYMVLPRFIYSINDLVKTFGFSDILFFFPSIYIGTSLFTIVLYSLIRGVSYGIYHKKSI